MPTPSHCHDVLVAESESAQQVDEPLLQTKVELKGLPDFNFTQSKSKLASIHFQHPTSSNGEQIWDRSDYRESASPATRFIRSFVHQCDSLIVA